MLAAGIWLAMIAMALAFLLRWRSAADQPPSKE
jgi:hypothetical protein